MQLTGSTDCSGIHCIIFTFVRWAL